MSAYRDKSDSNSAHITARILRLLTTRAMTTQEIVEQLEREDRPMHRRSIQRIIQTIDRDTGWAVFKTKGRNPEYYIR